MVSEAFLLKLLSAKPGTNYCAACLARLAGLTSPEDSLRVAGLMRSKFRKYTDYIVEDGPCAAGCGQTRLVVRLKP